MRFAKGDPDLARRLREKSFDYQRRKADEEPWVQTRVNQVKSARWEEETQRLFCGKMDDEIVALSQGGQQYLDALTKS